MSGDLRSFTGHGVAAFLPSPNWYSSSVASFNLNGYLAFGARNHVFIIKLRTQLTQASIKAHNGRVNGVAFLSADSGLVASCSADKSVAIWNYLTGSMLLRHNEHKVRPVNCRLSCFSPQSLTLSFCPSSPRCLVFLPLSVTTSLLLAAIRMVSW